MKTAEFVIARTFEAPIQRMWDAWTKPEQFGRWFGPKGVEVTPQVFDFRVGGRVHASMKGPDGSVSWALQQYCEIVEPSRLVWEQGFANAEGEYVPAPFPMAFPLRLLTTVVLEEQGNATLLTLTWDPIEASDEEVDSFISIMSSMTGGWTGTFDQLEAFLRETA
jgi:uncharacterized protein YndB with AHSA1/START domain